MRRLRTVGLVIDHHGAAVFPEYKVAHALQNYLSAVRLFLRNIGKVPVGRRKHRKWGFTQNHVGGIYPPAQIALKEFFKRFAAYCVCGGLIQFAYIYKPCNLGFEVVCGGNKIAILHESMHRRSVIGTRLCRTLQKFRHGGKIVFAAVVGFVKLGGGYLGADIRQRSLSVMRYSVRYFAADVFVGFKQCFRYALLRLGG